MEHISLPRHSPFQALRVPHFLHGPSKFADHKYRMEEFPGIPEALDDTSVDVLTQEEYYGFLRWIQARCYFALISEFFAAFNKSIEENLFLDLLPDPSDPASTVAFVTTKQLNVLFLELENLTRDPEDEDEIAESFEVADACLQEVRDYIIDLDLEPFRKREAALLKMSTGTNLIDIIHFSVIIIGRSLDEMLRLINTSGRDWGTATFLRERLLAAGWCHSETFSLIDELRGNPEVLFYLGYFNRHSLGLQQEHDNCTDSLRCERENLNLATYETKHCGDCSNRALCPDVVVDRHTHPELIQVLAEGGIPLITINSNKGRCSVTVSSAGIHVDSPMPSSNSNQPYICFSHVWSDGLGNPSANAIPTCQAIRLQKLANALYSSSEHPVPFWLDTLCVPLEKPARKQAITGMRYAYGYASKVLVLDSCCLEVPTNDVDATELAMRIRVSTWGRRLWTFQEACLARRLFYQFSNQALSLEDLLRAHLNECCELDKSLKEMTRDYQFPTGNYSNLDYTVARRMSVNPIFENASIWIRSQEDRQSGTEMKIASLLKCLRYRSTSHRVDETICLAGIFDIPIKPILKHDTAEDRMASFLRSFETLPKSLLFTDAPRLSKEGERWMPSTFLGGVANTTLIGMNRKMIPRLEGTELLAEGMFLEWPGAAEILARSMVDELQRLAVHYKGNTYELSMNDIKCRSRLNSFEPWALILQHPLIPFGDNPPGIIAGSSNAVAVTVLDRHGEDIVVKWECTAALLQVDEAITSPELGMICESQILGPSQKWLIT